MGGSPIAPNLFRNSDTFDCSPKTYIEQTYSPSKDIRVKTCCSKNTTLRKGQIFYTITCIEGVIWDMDRAINLHLLTSMHWVGDTFHEMCTRIAHSSFILQVDTSKFFTSFACWQKRIDCRQNQQFGSAYLGHHNMNLSGFLFSALHLLCSMGCEARKS